jgi:hypothetical protein
MDEAFELVYTVTDFFDGARGGVADFEGKPHAYRCVFDDTKNNWTDEFLLIPISQETHQLALEDWQIWLRWEEAFKAGEVLMASHPALPQDRVRHEQLKSLLASHLIILPINAHQAEAEFTVSEDKKTWFVRWTVRKRAGPDEWLRLLYSIGVETGVSLSDYATSRESLYDDHD